MPYSILKVLKQNNQTRWLHLVLYPTTFSRFSNYAAMLAVHLSFCTLQHSQGSKANTFIQMDDACFVPYSIFKVLKQNCKSPTDYQVLYPTAFSRFSNSMMAQKHIMIVLYPTASSRFSNYVWISISDQLVLYPTAFSRFSNLQKTLMHTVPQTSLLAF